MTVPPILTTTRLRLRPRTLEDIPDNLAMDQDPEVHRYIYINNKKLPDWREHEADLIHKTETGWPETGGLWVVEWQERPGFLGWCALFPLHNSDFIEIGYRYRQVAWGQGVATEAARAVLDYGFRELNFDPITAVTAPGNEASQSVLKKIGLQYQGIGFHYEMDLPFFKISKDTYFERR